MMLEQVLNGSIPMWGRTFSRAVRRLNQLGIVEREWADSMVGVVEKGRELAGNDTNAQQALLMQYLNSGITDICLRYDRKKGNYRIAFLGKNVTINGVQVTIAGIAPGNSASPIVLGEGEFALTGFDELLVVLNDRFISGGYASLWEQFNEALRRKSTDVYVVGSAGLNDPVGLFAMTSEGNRVSIYEKGDVAALARSGTPIYVKGMYEGLVYQLLGTTEIDVRPVRDIEEMLRNGRAIGIDVVDTGQTVIDNKLVIYGTPMLVTETLIIVDKGRYDRQSELRQAVAGLNPKTTPSNGLYERIGSALGDRWINRPTEADKIQ